jgi:hypothetical protein
MPATSAPEERNPDAVHPPSGPSPATSTSFEAYPPDQAPRAASPDVRSV